MPRFQLHAAQRTRQQLDDRPLDFNRLALNIGIDANGAAVELPEGGGPFNPFGWDGVLKSLPFAIWFLLAIEQLPLAAEESHDPKHDMPRGILYGLVTLIVVSFLTVILSVGIEPGAAKVNPTEFDEVIKKLDELQK